MRAVLCGLVVVFAGCGVAGKRPTEPGKQDAKQSGGQDAKQDAKQLTREEFKTLVKGKTPDEVIAAVGKPDKTSEGGGSTEWFYFNRTIDPVTDKVDGSAMVVFIGGRVDHVTY